MNIAKKSAEKTAEKTVHLIDTGYMTESAGPGVAAAYLIVEGDRASFVENNTTHAVPRLLNALKEHGLSPSQVDYLIITHVHLDHAGGTWALSQACPNAQVLAHPKAARHVIDPARLVASAKTVYGEERFASLYGEIRGVDSARVRALDDETLLNWGSRTLRFIHTRGHANHHFCIHDSKSNGVFAGDSFGLAYPRFQGKRLFLFPSTSPTDFDPEEARASVEKILATGASTAYLTHFGEVPLTRESCDELLVHLEVSERIFEICLRSDWTPQQMAQFCFKQLVDYYEDVLKERGVELTPDLKKFLKFDLAINADGIAFAADRKREDRGPFGNA